MNLLKKEQEEEKSNFSILNYSVYYNQEKLNEFFNQINQQIKKSPLTNKAITIKVDGKDVGILQIPPTDNILSLKNIVENFVLEKLKQKDPNQEKSHIIKIIYNPEPEEKQAPIALDIYAESSDRKKEFEAIKTKEEKIILELEKGYLVITPFSYSAPAQTYGRDYIQRSGEEQSIKELLNNIENPEKKDIYLTITLEDPIKLAENEKIKDNIKSLFQNKFHSLTIQFKSLNTEDVAELLNANAIKENQLTALKKGLVFAIDKNGNPAFSEKEKKMILDSKDSKEMVNALQKLDKEIYFPKEKRDSHPILEQIYSYYRKIDVFEKELNISLSSNGIIHNTNNIDLVVNNPSLGTIYTNNSSSISLPIYINKNINTEQHFTVKTTDAKLLYSCVYIPKEKEEEFKEYKGVVVFDFSLDIERFMGKKLLESIKSYIMQNPQKRMIELEKNNPKNYQIFFENLNDMLWKYIHKPQILTENEKNLVQTIKEDGLTIIGDMAITDPNKWVKPETLEKFFDYVQEIAPDGIRIRLLVIAPEKFTYPIRGTKEKGVNTKEKRLDELKEVIGNLTEEKINDNTFYYKSKNHYKLKNSEIEIVWVSSKQDGVYDPIKNYLGYFKN